MSAATLVEFVGRPLDLADLTEDLLNLWLRDNPRKWAPSTLRRRRADILTVWEYAVESGHTETEPRRRRVRRVRVPRRIPIAWSTEELARMIAAARTLRKYLPNGVRLGLLAEITIRVGYDTGLRCDDLLRLPRNCVNSSPTRISQEKKRGDQVLCRVRQSTMDLIATLPREECRVIAWPYRREYFYEGCWYKMLAAAGLPIGKSEGLQKLRRTSISHAERKETGLGAIQAGHQPGSRVTAASYIDPVVAYSARDLPPELP